MHDVFLIAAAFLATGVEMVEAMTIVLAVGITRGWRSALAGVACAAVALTLVIAVLGKSLEEFVPIDVLLVVIGALLLVFGMQWLRKAIERSVGTRALHDEERIFQEEVEELEEMPSAVLMSNAIDWNGFVVSFKGVFLEGLEAAFIVISFGAANEGRYDLAIGGAVAAVVIVAAVGFAVHRPLSRVPENSIKFAVGVMLMAFSTFWGAEGVGLEWTLEAGTILILAAFYWLSALVLIAMLRPRVRAAAATEVKA